MLSIHDPDTIKKKLAGRAAWLCPVEHTPASTNYLVATLVRIEQEFNNLAPGVSHSGFHGLAHGQKALDDLHQFQQDAAGYFSDYLEQVKPDLDTDAYAIEVLRHSRAGLTLNNKNLGKVLDGLSSHLGHEVLWCLSFVDFDIHFAQHVPFLNFLLRFNFPNMVIFLVRDEAVQLSEPYERANTIIGLDTQEMYDLIAEIKPTLAPPLPVPAPPPPVAFPPLTTPDDEDDDPLLGEQPKPRKKPKPAPKYRSIDEE
jgi:hypothetical protein